MSTTYLSHSSHWGAFTAEVRDGRLVGVQPFEHDGQPSPMIDAMPAVVHDEARVASPMVRQGYLRDGPSAGGEGRGTQYTGRSAVFDEPRCSPGRRQTVVTAEPDAV